MSETEYPKTLLNTMTVNGEKWMAGKGPIPARVMLIGQNPLTGEVRNNTVFNSEGAELLKRMMREHSVDPAAVYMTYCVKYATYQDKAPKASDRKACADVLADEIERVNPDLIVTLGTPAFQSVMGTGFKLTTYMGSFVASKKFEGRTVYPVWNPGYILRNPQYEYQYRKSFGEIHDWLEGTFTESSVGVNYTVIASDDQFAEFLADTAAMKPDILLLDCEWEGENYMAPGSYLRTFQIGRAPDDTVILRFYPTGPDIDPSKRYPDCCDPDVCMPMMAEFLKATDTPVGGQNIRGDGHWMRRHGLDIAPYTKYDTMLAEHLIDNTGKFGLTDMTVKYTNLGRYDAELERWKKDNSELVENGYGAIPEEILFPYAALDVEAPRRIMYKQMEQLDPYLGRRGHKGEYESLFECVMRTAIDLYELEETGILIDQERLKEMTDLYHQKLAELKGSFSTMVVKRGLSDTFNPDSVLQVRKLLFGPESEGGLGLIPITSTGTSKKQWNWVMRQPPEIRKHYNPSTDQQTLEILSEKSPIVRQLLNIRRVGQVCKNFLRQDDTGGIKGNIWPDGKLHPEYHQLTNTGRFGTRNPNCQNWSKSAERFLVEIFGKDNMPKSMRSVGIPPEGCVMIEGDFCQAELFTLQGLSGDPNMEKALTTPGKDLHDDTAIHSFYLELLLEGNPVDEQWLLDIARDDPELFAKVQKELHYRMRDGNILTRSQFKNGLRVAAKAVNFGIPYGRGANAIAMQIKAETGVDVPVSDVQAMIDGWKANYNRAWAYLVSCQDRVLNPGYVETPWGRRRYFPRTHDQMTIMANQREAMNMPVQSTVADTMRIACSRMLDERDRLGLKTKIAIQIHDALMTVTPEDEVDIVKDMFVRIMGNIPIPMPTGKYTTLGVDLDVYSRWGEKIN